MDRLQECQQWVYMQLDVTEKYVATLKKLDLQRYPKLHQHCFYQLGRIEALVDIRQKFGLSNLEDMMNWWLKKVIPHCAQKLSRRQKSDLHKPEAIEYCIGKLQTLQEFADRWQRCKEQ